MTREDWMWVAIRVFGIYLLVLAVLSVASVIGGAYAAASLHGFALDLPDEASDLTKFAQRLVGNHVQLLLTDCVRLVVCAAAGGDLVSRGRLVFRLVSRQNPLSERQGRANGL